MGCDSARGAWTILLAAAIATVPAAGEARSVGLADGQPRDLATVATGDKVVFDQPGGTLAFAGRDLILDGFVGVAGYASEAAYLLVLRGSAAAGDATAGPGEMLLLPPFGGKAMVDRFDAARFRKGWNPTVIAAAPDAYAALSALARRQKLGIFFGRYDRTRFNVAMSGRARREPGRREVVGNPTVRAIRFGSVTEPGAVERQVVQRFAQALGNGDADTAAALLDPASFGGEAMGPGGAAARLAYARTLIAERNWKQQLAAAQMERLAGGWLLTGTGGSTRIGLRATPQFAFVQSVKTGDGQ